MPLDATGVAQAVRAARLLAALEPHLIVSSPLARAAATADALASLIDLSVSYDDRLVERYGGQWEGLTISEIWDRYPEAAVHWQPADGEHEDAVGKRVAAAFDDALTRTPAGATVVVVSHGGALRCGVARFLGLPEELWWRLGPLGNCAWSLLGEAPDDSRGWRLLEHNAGTLPEPVLSDDR